MEKSCPEPKSLSVLSFSICSKFFNSKSRVFVSDFLNEFSFSMTQTILMRRIRLLHSFSVVFLYWFYVFS
nr:hypothetical protein CFP56_27868 [Quercus suber]